MVPRALGPRVGKQVQQVIKAVKAGDWELVDGAPVAAGVTLAEGEYELQAGRRRRRALGAAARRRGRRRAGHRRSPRSWPPRGWPATWSGWCSRPAATPTWTSPTGSRWSAGGLAGGASRRSRRTGDFVARGGAGRRRRASPTVDRDRLRRRGRRGRAGHGGRAPGDQPVTSARRADAGPPVGEIVAASATVTPPATTCSPPEDPCRCSTHRQAHRRHRRCASAGARTSRAWSTSRTTGGAIFAGNHLSVADELFLGTVVPRHIAFWAKSEYFTGTGVGAALTKFGHERPRARSRSSAAGGRAALSAFDARDPGAQGRRPGRGLPGGHPLPGRPALPGAYRRGPAGARRRRADHPGRHDRHRRRCSRSAPGCPGWARARSRVKFGKPMDFTGRPDDRDSLRAMTDEVMAEIQKLTGQEYVAEYRRAAAASRTRPPRADRPRQPPNRPRPAPSRCGPRSCGLRPPGFLPARPGRLRRSPG